MKKIFLFLYFLTLIGYQSNSYSLPKDIFQSFGRENSGKDIPTFAIVQELNKKYREDPNLNTDQKIKFIIEALSFAAPYMPDQDFENLIKESESIILINAKDTDIAIAQGVFFISMLNKRSYQNPVKGYVWPFSISKEEVFLKLDQLTELEKCSIGRIGCEKLKNIPFVKSFLALITTPTYINYGKYDQARAAINEMLIGFNTRPDKLLSAKEIEDWPDLQKFYLYLAYGMKYRLAEATGTLDISIEETKYISENFYVLMKYMEKNEKTLGINYGDFRWVYELDFKIGRYDRVLDKARYLLSKMPINNKNFVITSGRSLIMKDIAETYQKVGLFDLAAKYRDDSVELDTYTGLIDTRTIGFKMYDSLINNDYENANKFVNIYDSKVCNAASDESQDKKSCNEFVSNFKELLSARKGAVSESQKKEFEYKHWSRSAEWYEKNILNTSLKNSSASNDLLMIDDYLFMHDAYAWGGNKILAAYYGKKYVNTIQKLRAEISGSKENLLEIFTESHAENIKKISSTFYEINDFQAAWACISIIKENEFLDFVRRRGVDDKFLTTISLSKPEAEYSIKYDLLVNEIRILNEKFPTKDNLELKRLIKSKEDSLDALKRDFLVKSKRFYAENLTKNRTDSPVSLSSGEAAIQFLVTEKNLTIYVSTSTENKKIDKPISKVSFRQDILDLQRVLSGKKEIDQTKVNNLSILLFSESFDFLKDKNIHKIKVKTDDFISLIPLSVLNDNGSAINSKYVIESIGIANKNIKYSKVNNFDLNAFAASKGSSDNKFKPLPGAKNEIDLIMNLNFSNKQARLKSYVDSDFTRESFKKSFYNDISYVHVATHFKADGNLASTSKMLLGDGSLMSLEEMRDDIPKIKTNLVALSACNTGDVITSSNKSFEGLASVFQQKGARNVLSTLWEIDDQATSDFMGIFYSILFNNKVSPSQALAYTQNIFRAGKPDMDRLKINFGHDTQTLSLLKNVSKYSHPYYWSAFQVSTIN
jgi:CHAT domain-containing protein